MTKEAKPISFIGAPTDIGSGRRGSVMGPEALRVADLEGALMRLGHKIFDKGNLAGPKNPQMPPYQGYRHLSETIDWCTLVREAVFESLMSNEIPVLLGGDHSLGIGSISAVAQYCAMQNKSLNVIWLDAHADFNTANTSPSGNIHGMPLAALCGIGHPELIKVKDSRPYADFNNIVQIGIRAVDQLEKEQLKNFDINVFDMRMIDEYGMREVMKRALDIVDTPDAHLHVSFDIDFLDPQIAPGVATRVQGGPNYREAQLCMEMIHDSGLLSSLDIVELNPAFDQDNKTAILAVELVESLFGKQILARNPVH